MEGFKCKKCKNILKTKQSLSRHENICGNKNPKITFECEYCESVFSRNDSLKRHYNTCKCKKMTIKNNNNNNNNTTKKNNNITKKNNINANIKGNNNKIIQKPIYNVNLIMFSKDGIKSLGSKEYKKIFGSEKHMIEELITQINFNPDKPQHHNVYCQDLNEILNDMNDFLSKKKREKIKRALEDANHQSTPPGSRKKMMKYIKAILYNKKI